jgi:A/G-specific adenine glycosylase
MHFTALEIVAKHNGIFPKTSADLKKLKGIGDYTAAAIASICYNEPIAVLDGNVARVVSRLFAFETAVDTTTGRAGITSLANEMMDSRDPGTFNQALMELGATVCTPKNPACLSCPLSFACEALKRKDIEKYPLKSPKKTPVIRYMNYMVMSFWQNGIEHFVMRKRTGNDIWKNMFDFLCIETENPTETADVLSMFLKHSLAQELPFTVHHISDEYIHQLTHRKLLARFYRIELHGIPEETVNTIFVRKNEINNFPLPRLIDKYLKESQL